MKYARKQKIKAELGMKECAYCGSEYNLTIDHKVPKILGGGDNIKNLQVLCFYCNTMKSGVRDEDIKRIFKLRDKIILYKQKRLKATILKIQKDEAQKSVPTRSKRIISRLLDLLDL